MLVVARCSLFTIVRLLIVGCCLLLGACGLWVAACLLAVHLLLILFASKMLMSFGVVRCVLLWLLCVGCCLLFAGWLLRLLY